jgi:hypothetical protein
VIYSEIVRPKIPELVLTAIIIVGLGIAYYFPYWYNSNESKEAISMVKPDFMLAYGQPTQEANPTTSHNFTSIDDVNEINSIKMRGAQATDEVNTFFSLIGNIAGSCAYRMNEDVTNVTLAQMCADLMIGYANTLRNFTESNQNTTNTILHG